MNGLRHRVRSNRICHVHTCLCVHVCWCARVSPSAANCQPCEQSVCAQSRAFVFRRTYLFGGLTTKQCLVDTPECGVYQDVRFADTSTNLTLKINKHAVCSTCMQGGGGLPDGSAAMQKELKRKKDYPNGVSCRTRPNPHANIQRLAIVQAHTNQPDEHVCTAAHDAFARIYSLYSRPPLLLLSHNLSPRRTKRTGSCF